VVAVPTLTALSPFKSLTHFKLLGLGVSLALYVHFPGLPLTATIVLRVLPLSTSVILLLSPFRTFELHVTAILPDCRLSQVYVSMVTVSCIVGLILKVTVALLRFVLLDFWEMRREKVKDVSVLTFGARKVARALLALLRLIEGVEGEVWVQLKFRSLSERPIAVFEPLSTMSVPTRRADVKPEMATIGAICGASGFGVDEGVGVAFGSGMSAGLHVFDGAGGLGPGKGDRGPYCLPSRKSPWTKPRMSLKGYGGGLVPGTSTSGKIHSLTAAMNWPAWIPSFVSLTGVLVVMRYSRVNGA
jgi:hypothetical protein